MSESEAAALLARVPLTPYTPHTETDANALLASLPACRKAGFAVAVSYTHLDVYKRQVFAKCSGKGQHCSGQHALTAVRHADTPENVGIRQAQRLSLSLIHI